MGTLELKTENEKRIQLAPRLLNTAAGTKGQLCGRITEGFPWGSAAPVSALGGGDVLPPCSDLVQAPLFTAMHSGGPLVRSVGCTALTSGPSSPGPRALSALTQR